LKGDFETCHVGEEVEGAILVVFGFGVLDCCAEVRGPVQWDLRVLLMGGRTKVWLGAIEVKDGAGMEV